MFHFPVMLKEVIKFLNIKSNGIYLDATFGMGGHSKFILEKINEGRLFVFDKDPDSILVAKKVFEYDKRLFYKCLSLKYVPFFCSKIDINGKINGILIDLGISSLQLSNSNRGFSFYNNGLLDMRINQTIGITASDFLNNVSEGDLSDIFSVYCNKENHFFLSNHILKNRKSKQILTSYDLSDVIKKYKLCNKNDKLINKVFQSIRMYINDELYDLVFFYPMYLICLQIMGDW